MAKTGQNVEMYQGDFHEMYVTIYDANGNLVDLSGATILWVLYKRSPYPGNVVMSKTDSSGITVTGLGTLTITIDPADTPTFVGNYNHECQVTDTSSHPVTVFTGSFTIYLSKT